MNSRLYKLAARFSARAVILMYHRVANAPGDPWQLAVSPANFEQHLRVLQQWGLVISMPELVAQQRLQAIKPNSVVITFDDGYIDNYTTAWPLLQKYQLPVTYYIATGNIGRFKEFWWDELFRLLLHSQTLPAQLTLAVAPEPLHFDLGEDSVLTPALRQAHAQWQDYGLPPTRRSKLYMALWYKLIRLEASQQEKILTDLRHWAGQPDEPRPDYTSMTTKQLQLLARNPLMTVGAHTVNHTALGYQQATTQEAQIRESKIYLEELTGNKTNHFSYPNGSHNSVTRAILKKQGFTAAVTTSHQVVSRFANPYQLSRFQVNDWDGATFKNHLQNWLKG